MERKGVNREIELEKIIITQNRKKSTVGTITTVELEDFYIDDYKVEGVKKIENLGKHPTSFLFQNHVIVTDGKVKNPTETEKVTVIGILKGLNAAKSDEWAITLEEAVIETLTASGRAIFIDP